MDRDRAVLSAQDRKKIADWMGHEGIFITDGYGVEYYYIFKSSVSAEERRAFNITLDKSLSNTEEYDPVNNAEEYTSILTHLIFTCGAVVEVGEDGCYIKIHSFLDCYNWEVEQLGLGGAACFAALEVIKADSN